MCSGLERDDASSEFSKCFLLLNCTANRAVRKKISRKVFGITLRDSQDAGLVCAPVAAWQGAMYMTINLR